MLVWIDCEMTGLDVETDKIIEIACLITNNDLDIIAKGPNIIIHQSEETLNAMNDWCKIHHQKSGLLDQVLSSSISIEEAQEKVLGFIKEHIPLKNQGILAGNSVHMDKFFLMKQMPLVIDHLHYRLIDVSTIKELAIRWNAKLVKGVPAKKSNHRALDDILESIEELVYYKKRMFC